MGEGNMDLTNINACILYKSCRFSENPLECRTRMSQLRRKGHVSPLFPNFTGKCRTNRGGKCFVREDPNGGMASSYNAYSHRAKAEAKANIFLDVCHFSFFLCYFSLFHECALTLWEFQCSKRPSFHAVFGKNWMKKG